MAMIDALPCDLSARITPGDAKCDLYFRSGYPSCRVCSTRGGTKLKVGDAMSAKRGDCVVCGKTDITLPVTGKCSVCYERYRKETGQKGPLVVSRPAPKKRDDIKNKAVSDAAVEMAVPVQVEEIVLCDECGNDPCLCVVECVDSIPATFGKVVNGDGERVPFGVDEVIWFALEDALNAKKREWMVELSGLKPGRAICRTAEILKIVEGY
jgi:hypothetical protein